MYYGRPNGEGIWFRADGFKAHTTSAKLKADVSGEAFYIGEFEDGQYCGPGKFFFTRGNIFTGEWSKDLMKQGEMLRLGDDSSIKVYDEVYNVENDIKGEKLAVS